MARLPLVTEAQVSPDLASVNQKVASTESSMATTNQAILEQHFLDNDPFSQEVVANLIHASHSPGLGMRIWPLA